FAAAFRRRGRGVTVGALHAERRDEVLHRLEDLWLRAVFGQDLQILRRGSLSAASLRSGSLLREGCRRHHERQCQRDDQSAESHVTSYCPGCVVTGVVVVPGAAAGGGSTGIAAPRWHVMHCTRVN